MENSSDARFGAGACATAGIDSRSCVTCGSVGYPGDKFCACCGTQLMRLCNRCNAPIAQPVANYCTQCGQGLSLRAATV
jgi:predicted amidophosphoribosyltransferase